MTYEPLVIGNYSEGKVNNRKPFMIPEMAFPEMENAYVFRGRVKKKYGYKTVGRLRRCPTAVSAGNAPGAGTTFNLNIKTAASLETNATIIPGTITIVIGGLITVEDDGLGGLTKTAGTATLDAGASSINYVTSVAVIELSAGAYGAEAVTVDLCYHPNLPVMGLRLRERAQINNEQLIAFDTTYAYRYVTGAWQELPSTPAVTWTGSDSQYFWTTNFENPGTQRLFWATNYDGQTYTDPIRYYDDTVPQWVSFTPAINAGGDTLDGAVVLLPYKERMLAFNTRETISAAAVQFPQRLRYSQIGNIADATNGWLDDVQGRGGYVDAPTSEAIVSVGYIRDRLIVYFERSTWEIYYTGIQADPFVWRKVNTELGAESTFSLIQFDNAIVGVGNTGIHSSNGDSVQRIDEQIPTQAFEFYNDNAAYNRVYGIRDFFNELVIWSWRYKTTTADSDDFPNRCLIYNYKDNNWATWKESWTCFGYQQRANDITWADLTDSWATTNIKWAEAQGNSVFRYLVAGNQQGYVFEIDGNSSDVAPSRYVDTVASATASTTTIKSTDHNFEVDDYVQIDDGSGLTWTPNAFGENIFRVVSITDDDNFIIDGVFTGTYLGGAELEKLDSFDIRTKFFIASWKQARSVSLNYVDFLLSRTAEGQLTYNLYQNDDSTNAVNNPSFAVGQLGDPGDQNKVRTYQEDLNPTQFASDTIWHRNFSSTEANSIQLRLYLDEDQMRQRTQATSQIELHGTILYIKEVDGMI